VFSDPDVSKTLNSLHDRYFVALADKAANNVVFICKKILLPVFGQ